jgi:hypothetical protein
MSNRRSKKVTGYVNFPVDSKEYICNGQGGLFVELWVIPTKGKWMNCCGGQGITSTYGATLVGTNEKRNFDNWNEVKKDHKLPQRFYLEEKLFPNKGNPDYDYNSIPLYAAILLGSTGWSGYSQKKGNWRASFYDLNRAGLILCDSLNKLYGNKATLRLVTWLDT